MAMTIKNERVLLKIRDLANMLKVDQVRAVEVAVEHMFRQASQSQGEQRLHEVLELAATIRSAVGPPEALDTDGLYDHQGLPR